MRSTHCPGGQGRGCAPPIVYLFIYRNFGEVRVLRGRRAVGGNVKRRGQDPSLRYKTARSRVTETRGRGMPRPCGVPVMLLLPQGSTEGSSPLPTSNRMTSGCRQSTHFRQVAGTHSCVPAVCPLGYIVGTAANGRHICRPYGLPVMLLLPQGSTLWFQITISNKLNEHPNLSLAAPVSA